MDSQDNDATTADGVPADRTELSSLFDAVPTQAWDVRRRHYGERWWLVRHNEVYELDRVADAAWRACGEGRRVAAVARAVADDLGLAPTDALEPTITALVALNDAGLLRFTQEA